MIWIREQKKLAPVTQSPNQEAFLIWSDAQCYRISKYSRLKLFISMITDASNLRIVKSTASQLVMMDQNKNKYHYREVEVTDQKSFDQLCQRTFISHPSLIRLQRMFVAADSPMEACRGQEMVSETDGKREQLSHSTTRGRRVGLLTEFYTSSLSNLVRSYRDPLTFEEIVNTFQPIVEGVEFLISQGCFPQEMSLENIVITEDETIKFMDNCFLQSSVGVQAAEKLEEYKIYAKLAELIFEMMFPNQRSKSWKLRVRLAKSQLSKANYSFFMKIYSKSLMHFNVPSKMVKIRKAVSKLSKNRSKFSPLHSKENQIVQQ